jgi:hypothetical protein
MPGTIVAEREGFRHFFRIRCPKCQRIIHVNFDELIQTGKMFVTCARCNVKVLQRE